MEESQEKKIKFVVANLDVNRLKFINDKFGHSAGSILIQRAANSIVIAAGSKSICFRLGGDEFVVILKDSDKKNANEFNQKLKSELLLQRFTIDGQEIIPSIAMGFSIFPDNGKTREELMHFADIEMYKNKAFIKANEILK